MLGGTRVALTELGFGAAPIGNLRRAVDDATAYAAIDTAWRGGVRYFDTAPHYGLGLSERRLGEALAGRPRADFVVSTKVGRLLERHPRPTGSDLAAGGFDVPDDLRRRWDFSADGMRRSIDESLRRLKLDHVDVVYVHDPDDFVEQAVTQAVPALVELKEQGVVGAVGVGMNHWRALLEIVRRCDLDVVMIAGRWTLLDRSAAPLLDECAARGVSVVAAAPFNSGLLAAARPDPGATFDYGPASADVFAAAEGLADTCAANGIPLPAAALQFPLLHPAVRSVVAGFRSPGHVSVALDHLGTAITAEAWSKIV